MGYGFRLYNVRLVKGIGGSKEVPFEECGMTGADHLSVWVGRLLTELESHETLTGMPRLRLGVGDVRLPIDHHAALAPTRGDPQIRWRKHSIAGPQKITFEVQYGTVGRFDWAIAQKASDDADISKKSAAHVFRGILCLPKKGTLGVLALEAVDNSSPNEIVHHWLARAAIHEYDKDVVARDLLTTDQAATLAPGDLQDELQPDCQLSEAQENDQSRATPRRWSCGRWRSPRAANPPSRR